MKRVANLVDPVVVFWSRVGENLVGGELSAADALDIGAQFCPSGC